MKNLPRTLAFLLLASAPLIAGCDKLGIETAAARKEAESKAVGSGCRHAGRAIEDCYALNKTADKAAVFAGWRDMNDYMRDKKIEEVKPTLDPASVSAKAAAHKPAPDAGSDDDQSGAAAAKPAKKVAKH
jgi:hypothetical protein